MAGGAKEMKTDTEAIKLFSIKLGTIRIEVTRVKPIKHKDYESI
jgi:hypothetical protein